MASFHLFLCSITFLLLSYIKSSHSTPTGFLLICPLVTQIYENGFGGYIPPQWKAVAEDPTGSTESTSLLPMRVFKKGAHTSKFTAVHEGACGRGAHTSKSFVLKWCYVATSGIIVIILLSNLEIESAMFFSSN